MNILLKLLKNHIIKNNNRYWTYDKNKYSGMYLKCEEIVF